MERKGPTDSTARYHHGPLRSSPANGLWQVVTSGVRLQGGYVCPSSPAPTLQEPRSLETSGVFHLDGRLEDCPGRASQKLPQRASAAALARPRRARLGTPSAGTRTGDAPRGSRRPTSVILQTGFRVLTALSDGTRTPKRGVKVSQGPEREPEF